MSHRVGLALSIGLFVVTGCSCGAGSEDGEVTEVMDVGASEDDTGMPPRTCMGTTRFAEARTDRTLGPPTQALVAADMDADGLLDLVATLDLGAIVVLRNRGTEPDSSARAFSVPVRLEGEVAGAGVAVTDWNGDGRPDLLGLTRGGKLTLFENRSSGSTIRFEKVGETRAPHNCEELAIADMNGDGREDIIAYGNGTTIWPAPDEQGGLQEPFTELELFGRRGAVGDLDGDGNMDVVLAVFSRNRTLTVGYGDGRGRISRVVEHLVTTDPPVQSLEAALGDVDGDGNTDVVVVGRTWIENDILGRKPRLFWLRGLGGGELEETAELELSPGHGGWSVALEDLDGDGIAEVVAFAGGLVRDAADLNEEPTEIPGGFHFFSHHEGTLRSFDPGYIETGTAWGRFVVTDLDGDGLKDIAHATGVLTLHWGCEG